jgi:uncharacterized membrane protein YeaQ/YmgE (transglycosylase-associated protein family)
VEWDEPMDSLNNWLEMVIRGILIGVVASKIKKYHDA